MFRRILVPIDGSGAGRQGLSEALRLAPAWGATLRLLNVTCACRFALEMTTPGRPRRLPPLAQERADHLLDDASALGRKAGLVVETTVRELVHGTPASAIVEEACLQRLRPDRHGNARTKRARSCRRREQRRGSRAQECRAGARRAPAQGPPAPRPDRDIDDCQGATRRGPYIGMTPAPHQRAPMKHDSPSERLSGPLALCCAIAVFPRCSLRCRNRDARRPSQRSSRRRRDRAEIDLGPCRRLCGVGSAPAARGDGRPRVRGRGHRALRRRVARRGVSLHLRGRQPRGRRARARHGRGQSGFGQEGLRWRRRSQ